MFGNCIFSTRRAPASLTYAPQLTERVQQQVYNSCNTCTKRVLNNRASCNECEMICSEVTRQKNAKSSLKVPLALIKIKKSATTN